MTMEELRDYNSLCELLSDHPIRKTIEKINSPKLNIDVCIPTLRGIPPSLIATLRNETSGSIHISMVKPLSYARIELIKKVKTALFLFLDDDILYPKGHLKLLTSYFNEDVGAVQGSLISYGLGEKWDIALQKNTLKTIKSDADRLFGSNMLIRLSLVEDWNPPLNLSGCEDWDLTNHIRTKGYDCLLIPSKIKHKTSWFKTFKNALWFGNAYPNLFKKFPLSYFLKLFLVIGKSIIIFPFNPRLSIFIIYQNIFIICGMLKNWLLKIIR
ncbi:hypothetical protein ES702_03916 [subsurface metagenome]